MLIEESESRDVLGLTPIEKRRIQDFLQGAVYCWCKHQKDNWFALRDLMGGDNYYWRGTPLMALYRKHRKDGKDTKTSALFAGKDGGWLLKKVIVSDKRIFDSKIESQVRKYRWTGEIQIGENTRDIL